MWKKTFTVAEVVWLSALRVGALARLTVQIHMSDTTEAWCRDIIQPWLVLHAPDQQLIG